MNYRIYARPQSIKQDDQSFISILDCPLPVGYITNTINDQFDRNAILTVHRVSQKKKETHIQTSLFKKL